MSRIDREVRVVLERETEQAEDDERQALIIPAAAETSNDIFNLQVR
mgnify:CR=1 FL=1